MKVNFHNQTNLKIRRYKRIIRKALKKEKCSSSMEVIFLDDEQIKEMNKTYRNINEVTDVLSFPNDDLETDSLGDIFISVPRALRQAKQYGHSDKRELAFLAVHGYLHLIGFDHETKQEEEIMFKRQEEILSKNFSKDSRITVILMGAISTIIYEIVVCVLKYFAIGINFEIIPFLKILGIEVIYNILLTTILYPLMKITGNEIESEIKGNRIFTRYF